MKVVTLPGRQDRKVDRRRIYREKATHSRIAHRNKAISLRQKETSVRFFGNFQIFEFCQVMIRESDFIWKYLIILIFLLMVLNV